MPAYLVLLRVEIARFTRPPGLRPESRRLLSQPARPEFRGIAALERDFAGGLRHLLVRTTDSSLLL